MSTTRDDGGPAFPRDEAGFNFERGTVVNAHGGMSKREWFAGKALTGLMADPGMRPSSLDEFEHMATRLFQVADAMIAESKKGDPA